MRPARLIGTGGEPIGSPLFNPYMRPSRERVPEGILGFIRIIQTGPGGTKNTKKIKRHIG